MLAHQNPFSTMFSFSETDQLTSISVEVFCRNISRFSVEESELLGWGNKAGVEHILIKI